MPDRRYQLCKRREKVGKCANQQREINNGHGLLLVSVRLHWHDVSKEKAGLTIQRERPRSAAEAGRGCTSIRAEASSLGRCCVTG